MLILSKIIKIVAKTGHQMSDFKAKMHQIRFRLGLRPRPRWGSLLHSPKPSSCDTLLLGGGGKGGREGDWRGRDGKGEEGKGREGRGRGGEDRGEGEMRSPTSSILL